MLRSLVKPLSLILSLGLIFNPCYASDLIADGSSISIERVGANKVPMAHIERPNDKGVSHNRFQEYNVNKEGLILNNSNKLVNTELGGHILNNKNFGGGKTASVILNEITGTKKSELLGYTEVAGDKADVIVANPNGIYVEGGGFINVNQAILTTGKLSFKNGELKGFNVDGGEISVGPLGFNANNIERLNLYSKTLYLNAALYAKELNVVLGDNDIGLDGSIISKESYDSGLSLDSSALGGLYANAITLISSDKGVGVNLPPEVLLGDSLTLRANGDIAVNTIASDNEVSLIADGDVRVEDTVLAQKIEIKALNLHNKGEINALNGDKTSVIDIKNDLINDALIGGYNLNIFSQNILNSRDSALYAKNNLIVYSNHLTNYGYIRSDGDTLLNIRDVLDNYAGIFSIGDLEIRANDDKEKINAVNNVNGSTIESKGDISVFAKEINNIAAAPIYTTVNNETSYRIDGDHHLTYDYVTVKVDNETLIEANNPSKILSAGSININTKNLTNAYSLIASDEDIVLNADLVRNIGKVATATVTTITKVYKKEKRHTRLHARCYEYASHKRTITDPRTFLSPSLNYGIQAKGTIKGNIVTLENVRYNLEDPVKEAQIRDQQHKLDTLEGKNNDLTHIIDFLNGLKNDIETYDPENGNIFDITELFNYDENVKFNDYKNRFIEIADEYGELRDDNNIALADLRNLLEDIKRIDEYADYASGIQASIEDKIDNLKANLELIETKIETFKSIYDILNSNSDVDENTMLLDVLSVDDADSYVARLSDANKDIKDLFASNIDILVNSELLDKTADLSNALKTDAETLRTIIYAELDKYGSVEDKIITQEEGIYRIGAVDDSAGNAKEVKFGDIKIGGVSIPQGKYGEFIKSNNPNYLIESNPLYSDFNDYIGSGYLQERLNFDQELTFKRLGDGAYETRLIRDAIIAQSGSRYLNGYYSDLDQFQALMDNALEAREDLRLSYGTALTYEQIEVLDRDIVWMVLEEIGGEKVLAPKLYLSSNSINNYGPKIIAGENIVLNVAEDLTNTGVISSGKDIVIRAAELENAQGMVLSGGDINIYTDIELNNSGGVIAADKDVNVASGGTVTSSSLVKEESYSNGKQTNTVIGTSGKFISGGDIKIAANNDITLLNTDISANGDVYIASNKDVTIGKQIERDEYDFTSNKGYSRGLDVTNHGSSVTGGNVVIQAGGGIAIDTSNIDASENIVLNAKESVLISASNDVHYTNDKHTEKGGFGEKETVQTMSYQENTVSSKLNAGDIIIKSGKDVTLEAAELVAQEGIYVEAKENINVIAKVKKDAELYMKNKSSLGGLKKSLDLKESEAYTLSESNVKTIADNIVFKSGNDINVIASTIDAASSAQLEAFNKVMIAAGIESEFSREIHKESSFNVLNLINSFATVGLVTEPVYTSDSLKMEGRDITVKSSNVKAGENIVIKSGSTDIVGSDLEAGKHIAIKADTGGINILTAQEFENAFVEEKHIEVGLANTIDIIKSAVDTTEQDTKIKVTLASASVDENSRLGDSSKQVSSNLVAKGGNIILDSFDDVTVKGSSLQALEGDIIIASEVGNIDIQDAIETENIKEKDKHAEASISLTVQNEYVEIGSAIKAAIESAEQLKRVKGEYSSYKGEVKKLQNTLSDLKQRYKDKEPGIEYQDIEDLESVIDNIKDQEKYYVAAVAAASADLASKTVAIASQIASAAASSGTLGFSVGLALDVQGSKTDTSAQITKSVSSNLEAKNIILATNIDDDIFTSVNVKGSNLIAKESVGIQTGDLNALASAETLSQKQDSKDLTGSISVSMYGGGAGAGVSLGYGESHADVNEVRNINSNILAKNINVYTKGDANFEGATLRADDALDMYVGGDLDVSSVRDEYSSNEKGFNANGGFTLGNDKKYTSDSKAEQFSLNKQVGVRVGDGLGSSNANLGVSKGSSQSKEVVLSSVTGGKVNIEVKGNTNTKGSLIAAGEFDENGDFIDNKQLTIKTNTITHSSLTSSSYSGSNSLSVGIDVGLTKKDKNSDNPSVTPKIDSSTVAFSTDTGYSSEKTLATIGQGDIQIADEENSDDIDRLNRDTNHLNKKLYDTKTGTSVEAVIDHRMFTKEGREEIAGEFKQVADTLDDINRYVKDKAGDYRLTDDLKNNIEQNGIKDSLVDYLSKAGASDEDIQKILDNEKVQSLLEGYQEDKKINREYEIVKYENNQDTITLNPIVVTPSKDLKDYIVDGAGAINAIVEIVGEDKAAMAILITQFAIQGTVKTATSIMGDEAKDVVFGGVKNRLSDFIADEFFDVSDNEYWNNNEQKSINGLSYMISDFTVDAVVIGGPYAIIKKADKVAKTDSEFTGTITNKIDNDVDVKQSTGKTGDLGEGGTNSQVGGDSAKNVAQYEKYKQDLAFEEKYNYPLPKDKADFFNADGTIKTEYIKVNSNSKVITEGSDLKNTNLVNYLTKDGTDIKDWGKYGLTVEPKTDVSPGKQVHYYYNKQTGQVVYDYDYKTVINEGIQNR